MFKVSNEITSLRAPPNAPSTARQKGSRAFHASSHWLSPVDDVGSTLPLNEWCGIIPANAGEMAIAEAGKRDIGYVFTIRCCDKVKRLLVVARGKRTQKTETLLVAVEGILARRDLADEPHARSLAIFSLLKVLAPSAVLEIGPPDCSMCLRFDCIHSPTGPLAGGSDQAIITQTWAEASRYYRKEPTWR